MTFIFKSRKEVSLSEVFALFNWSSVGYISGICFSNSGLSMVNISSRYREVPLNMSPLFETHKNMFFMIRRVGYPLLLQLFGNWALVKITTPTEFWLLLRLTAVIRYLQLYSRVCTFACITVDGISVIYEDVYFCCRHKIDLMPCV